MLSPTLFTHFTHDCIPINNSYFIIKFADDFIVICLISDNNKMAYRTEVDHLVRWFKDNDVVLNTSKTKEMIIDFRRTNHKVHLPLYIHGEEGESVKRLKFLRVTMSKQLTWTINTSALVKKA